MEHRWGARATLDLPVKVENESHALAIAVLRDASVSGAFLCTSARLPLLTTVEITLVGRDESQPLEALVVRSAPDGIAIEWIEVAPPSIVELLVDAQRAFAAALEREAALDRAPSLDRVAMHERASPRMTSAASPATAGATAPSAAADQQLSR